MTQVELQAALVNDGFKASKKPEHLNAILDLYRLYVQMADQISHRRQAANSFFLSIDTAIVAAIGYLMIEKHALPFKDLVFFLPIFGGIISYVWYRLVRSYRDLNGGKFKVVHCLEQLLPVRPYDAEWKALGEGKDRKLYFPFTHIEMSLPWAFVFAFALILILISTGRVVVQ